MKNNTKYKIVFLTGTLNKNFQNENTDPIYCHLLQWNLKFDKFNWYKVRRYKTYLDTEKKGKRERLT